MTEDGTPPASTIRYLPGHLTTALAVAAMTGGWLVVVTGFAGTVAMLSRLGAAAVLPLVMMCGATVPAVLATRRVAAFRRLRTTVPAPLLRQRRYGDLAGFADDDSRPLRPVCVSLTEVLARTDAMLSPFTAFASVRIFQGVRVPGAARPLASYAVSAGRLLVLIESVAWPPGRYQTDASGRVRCNDQYIGQTVRALCRATRACRTLLPRSHQVCALVVVHRTSDGGYLLPADTGRLRWVLADDLPRDLHALLSPHLSSVSRHTIAALVGEPSRPGTR